MRRFGKAGKILRSPIIVLQLYLTMEVTIASSTTAPQNVKTFRVKTSGYGLPLCANNAASAIFNISQLNVSPVGTMCVPGSVLCATRCVLNDNCTSFNWKRDEELCELFYYSPSSCYVVPMCSYYEVFQTYNLSRIIYFN